ncbi:hypothetical protein GCM10027408_04830 [Microbacterium tumbae]
MAGTAVRVVHRLITSTVTAFLVVAVLVMAGWFVFSALTGATLITFRTGSMSPTMPQGSVAVSLPVRADEIEVGDVVTVLREGEELPVTHRVVEARDPAQASSQGIPADARELILKGDDNESVDLKPYVVDEARRVLFAIPGIGAALMLIQSPLGMGTLTVLAGALATWAFWPRRRRDDADAETDADEDAGPVAGMPVRDEATAVPPPQTRRERREAGARA